MSLHFDIVEVLYGAMHEDVVDEQSQHLWLPVSPLEPGGIRLCWINANGLLPTSAACPRCCPDIFETVSSVHCSEIFLMRLSSLICAINRNELLTAWAEVSGINIQGCRRIAH